MMGKLSLQMRLVFVILSTDTGISCPSKGPLYEHRLTLISAWISNYFHYNVWDEITYLFPNFNGCTVEVWEWINNSIHTLPGMWLLIHVSNRGHRYRLIRLSYHLLREKVVALIFCMENCVYSFLNIFAKYINSWPDAMIFVNNCTEEIIIQMCTLRTHKLIAIYCTVGGM